MAASASNTQSSYFIRAAGITGIDKLLRRLGAKPAIVFALAEVPLSAIEDDEQRIGYRNFLNLLNVSAEATGRRDFGFLLAEYQDIKILGALGIAMCEAPTLNHALQDLITHFDLHLGGAKVLLHQGPDTSILSYSVTLPQAPDYLHQIELALSIGIRFVRRYCGQSWNPEGLYFQFDESYSLNSTEMNQFYRCPVNFNQELNGFSIRNTTLVHQRAESDQKLHRILSEYMEMRKQKSEGDIVRDTTECIVAGLQVGRFSIDEIANQLGLSRRSFQRRLNSSNLNFKSMLEQTRMDLARHYLKMSTLPLTQIADILGYADSASFSRSFHRCHGDSPSNWRSASEHNSALLN